MPKAERDMNTLAPHVFGLVKDAFVAMQQDGVPQSVVITGESGSGKTATFKIALQYLLDTSKAQRAAQSGMSPAGAAAARGKTAMSAGAWCSPPQWMAVIVNSCSTAFCSTSSRAARACIALRGRARSLASSTAWWRWSL